MSRITGRILLSSVVLLAVLLLVQIWTASEEELATSFEDDAFYYFGVARSIASSGISTFDGTTETNGYHPLWMAAILPAFAVSDDLLLPLRIAGSISILLLSAGAFLGASAVIRKHPPLVSTLCLFLLLRYVRDFSSMVMETSILIPLCIAALVQADSLHRQRSGTGDFLRLGILLLLILLSRLDTVILVMLLGSAVLSRMPVESDRRRRAILAVSAPPSVGIISCLVLNRLLFGLFLPVSGVIKSSFLTFNGLFARQLFLLSDPLHLRSPWGLFLLFLSISIVFLTVVVLPRLRSSGKQAIQDGIQRDALEMVIPALMVIHTATYLFNSTWRLWYWYAWPAVLFTIFTLPDIATGVWQAFTRRFSAFRNLRVPDAVQVAAAVLLLPCSIYWGLNRGDPSAEDFRYRNLMVARQLNEELDPGVTIAMGDRAGSFSWFFEGRVLQLEGLMGDGEMLEAIRAGDLEAYVMRRAPDYLLSYTGPEGLSGYGEWGLLYPDRAQSTSAQDTIFVSSDDEIHRWESPGGSMFLWRL